MHAGIRAPGTYGFNAFIGDDFKRFFEALLYTQTGFLALPAVVPGAVVFDAERDANKLARQLGRESSSCCAC